jgi:hypothetical protein
MVSLDGSDVVPEAILDRHLIKKCNNAILQACRLSWHRVVAPVSGDQAEREILAKP